MSVSSWTQLFQGFKKKQDAVGGLPSKVIKLTAKNKTPKNTKIGLGWGKRGRTGDDRHMIIPNFTN